MTAKTCGLCGTTDHHVSPGLVEWADPIEGQRFSSLDRCQDREACRGRVEKAGQPWELADPTPPPTRELIR